MSDMTTTVGTFDLPECAPKDGGPVELSNEERTDRIIIASIEPSYSPLEGAMVEYDLYDEHCEPLGDFPRDYWENDIRDEVDFIIENWN